MGILRAIADRLSGHVECSGHAASKLACASSGRAQFARGLALSGLLIAASSHAAPPVAVDDTFVVSPSSVTFLDVLANDSDPNGDPLTLLAVSAVSPVLAGNASVDGGQVRFTAPLTPGVATFTYDITDGGPVRTATVKVSVEFPPRAFDDTATTDEDNAVLIDVLGNDVDPDTASLTIDSVGAAPSGTAVIQTGQILYTPNADTNGEDTFSYVVTDGSQTDTGSVTVTVNPINDPPTVAVALTDDSVDEDDTYNRNLAGTFADPDIATDGDSLALVASVQGTPTNSLTFTSVSIDTTDAANPTLVVEPSANANGSATIRVTAEDKDGESTFSEFTLTVTAVNDAPVAADDPDTTAEDTPVTISVLGNDTDVENDTLTVSLTGATAPSNGGVVVEADNTITYTPAANFNGVDTFTYFANDGATDSVTAATVTVTVTAANDDPVGVADAETTNEDTPVDIDVVANDTDVDIATNGQSLSVAALTLTDASNGTTSLNGDGTVRYTPNLNFNGSDSFTYSVTDGTATIGPVTVSVTVDAVNDDPVGVADAETTNEDTPVDIDVVANDTDVDIATNGQSLSVAALTLTDGSNGTTSLNGDGTVRYTPDPNFNGSDSFTYSVTDGSTTVGPVTVSLSIDAINDPPFVANAFVVADLNIDEDGSLAYDLETLPIFSDVDIGTNGDSLTYSANLLATSGSVVLETLSVTGSALNIVPAADTNGLINVNVRAVDSAGESVTASFVSRVEAVNDDPVIANAIADDSIDEDTTFTLDVETAPVFTDVDIATNGDSLTYSVALVGATNGLTFDTASFTDSTLTLDPTLNQNGQVTVRVTAEDTGGLSVTDEFLLTVDPVNDQPTLENAIADAAIDEDDLFTLDVETAPVFDDVDIVTNSDSLSYSVTVLSTTNGLAFDTASFSGGSTLTLDPSADLNGTANIRVTATDTGGLSATDEFVLTVDAVNDDPVIAKAIADDSIDEDTTFTLDVETAPVFTDVDIATNGDSLTYSVALVGATNGLTFDTASFTDSTLTLDPTLNQNGQVTVRVTAEDTGGLSVTDEFLLTVDPVNDQPTLENAIADAAIDEDDFFTLDVETAPVFDDVDIVTNSDSLSYSVTVLSTTNGLAFDTASFGGGSTLTLDPSADLNGTASIRVTATDTGGLFATDEFVLTVNAVNDNPVVANPIADTAINEDASFVIDVAAVPVFTDVDIATNGDSLTYTLTVLSTTNGLAFDIASFTGSTLTLEPGSNLAGTANIRVTATDTGGLFATDEFVLTVNDVNDPPFVDNGIADQSIEEDSSARNVNISNAFDDPDIASNGDSLTLSVVGNTNAVLFDDVSITGTTLRIDPAADRFGLADITVEARDTFGATVTTTFEVDLFNRDDTPRPNDDTATTNEDVDLIAFDPLANDFEDDSVGVPQSPGSLRIINASVDVGTVTVSADQLTFDYSPPLNFNGVATVTYEVIDNFGPKTEEAEVEITVNAVNDAPIVDQGVDPVTVDEDSGAFGRDISDAFTDVDIATNADILTLDASPSIVSSTGSLSFDTLSISGTTLNITPTANTNGTATVRARVTDSGGLSATTDFLVTVNPLNDAPTVVGVIPAQTLTEDQATESIDISAIFTDIDFGDVPASRLALTVAANTNPDLFALADTTNTSGQIDGSTLRLRPAPNRFGTATLTIRATDNGIPLPALFVETTVDVTIDPVDDAPDAVNDAVTMDEDTILSAYDPLANDTEVDTDGTAQAPGSNTITNAIADIGSVTITGGGLTLEYTPPLNFFGTATITYTIEDGFGTLTDFADVVVTVSQVDDAPTAVDDTVTMNEDSILTGFDPIVNDSEVDSTGLPRSPGTVRITAASVDPAQGVVGITGGGTTLNFLPVADFFGVATIDYTIEDGIGTLSDSAQVFVTVTNLDDPPNKTAPFGADSIVTDEDTPLTFNAIANDTQVDGPDGEPLVITSVTGGVLVAANGTVTTDGTNITYTPDADFFGFDNFNYIVRDSFGVLSTEVLVQVEVRQVDDAPRPVDDFTTTPEDTLLQGFNPVANDIEVDSTGLPLTPGTITIVDVSVPASQGIVGFSGNEIDYLPFQDFFGTATITYTVIDGIGAQTATATITVDVTPVDEPPEANDDVTSTDEDVPIIGFDPRTNDFEVDSTGVPQSPGSIVIVAADADTGSVAITNGGTTIDYTPQENFFGTDTIVYEITDQFGAATSQATITVNVAAVNDFPVASDDFYTFDEDVGDVVLVVADNDFLFDDPVTITVAGTTHTIDGLDFENSTESTPTTVEDATGDPITLPNGTLGISGTAIIYSPKADYNGTDFFTYTLQDPDGDSDTGRVDITINPVNDPPTAELIQNYSVVQDTSLTVDANSGVLVGAFDIDGDTLTATLQTPPANGTLVLNADGGFTYTPNLGFVGSDFFEFFVFDGTVVNEGDARIVEIEVDAAVVVVDPPDSGVVEDEIPLAQIPLELVEGVDPNVLILMDDSGSMDFSFATNESGAIFRLRNHGRSPRPRSRRTTFYYYVTDLPNNTYSRTGLPSEAELLGSSSFGTDSNPNQYGVWRGRHYLYNKIYYNPEVRYRPWRGIAADGNPFPEADPTDAVLNPWRPGEGFGKFVPSGNKGWDGNLRATWQYRSGSVPDWDNNGGSRTRTIESYYIPRYYVITDPDFTGEPAWNTPHCLVEIRPDGEGYTNKDEDADVPICGDYTESLGGGRFESNGLYPGGPDRTDCANPLECTFLEEIQNFANWFVYYRNREYTVKASLGAVVADVTGLNIGYATINRPTSERKFIAPMEASFRGDNKSDLLEQIYEINSSGGTPLRRNLDAAGKHFRCRSGDIFGSTSNSSPGTGTCPVAPAPAGLCQQQFTLLFTDGEWNGSYSSGVGNEDADEVGSPFDGGFFADGVSNTLGDVAMFYYETDIHTSLDNFVPTTARDRALAADDAFVDGGNDLMHQHVTTFTVGFGVDGNLTDADIPTELGGTPNTVNWLNPFNNGLAKFDDLRHAALNGRGDYLSAADPTELERELRSAFEEFGSGAGAASAVSFNSQQVRNDTRVFRGFYNTDDNTGDLVAQLIDFENNEVIDPPVWSTPEHIRKVVASHASPHARRLERLGGGPARLRGGGAALGAPRGADRAAGRMGAVHARRHALHPGAA